MSNLKRIREANSLSQSQLAKKSGVSLKMIQKYEQGVKDINKAQSLTVYALSIALDCEMWQLLEIGDCDNCIHSASIGHPFLFCEKKQDVVKVLQHCDDWKKKI